jgi:hypothetical protein
VAKGSRRNRKGKRLRPAPAEPNPVSQPILTFKLKTAALLAVGTGALVALIAASAFWLTRPQPYAPSSAQSELKFVGSQSCSGCHQAEAKLWQASQHRHAMDHATERSVRCDFNNATFEYAGVHSRFFQKDKKFFVETDGADGKLAVFGIKYTFGVDPLQQYLIEFPDGRIQALSIAWDTRPKSTGGQRWFHLYPNGAIGHDNPLHWTKLNQNWNHMCAECHSTGVRQEL